MHRSLRATRALVIAVISVMTASLLGTSSLAAGTDSPVTGTNATRRGLVRLVGRTPPLNQVSRNAARAPLGAAFAQARIDARMYRLRQLHDGEKDIQAPAFVTGPQPAPTAGSTPLSSRPTGRVASWEGLNHFDSRYSGGGNQFSGEPPDQGLCASDTRVFEVINSVLQVYTTDGRPLIAGHPFYPHSGPVGLTLNEFFGLEPSFDRQNLVFGQFLFDVACYYDPPSGRWFVTSAALKRTPRTGEFAGPSFTYIAVSETADPLGSYKIWRLNTTNNGENGTPKHRCPSGFCFGDYPQIGADENGFYITTNEFDILGNGRFNGAQLYAFSKADLVAGDRRPHVQYFQNIMARTLDAKAYTLQPVNALPNDWDRRNGGVMYFGMSVSPYAAHGENATGVVLWSLRNTSSIDSLTPSLKLADAVTRTEPYARPRYALQADGPTPLMRCENTIACIGFDYNFVRPPAPLDAGNSGKIYGAWLQEGNIYLTTGTMLQGIGAAKFRENGKWRSIRERVGVAWFRVKPTWTNGYGLRRTDQGYVAVRDQNLTFPSIVVGDDGIGAIGVTLTGPGYYPGQAYARFVAGSGVKAVRIAAQGIGPWDGFTASGDGGYDPRWGDYPAATIAPNGTIWIANEYIGQRCTFDEWSRDTTCGKTRTLLANWSTRITALRFG